VVFELDPTGNETVLYSFARVAKTPAPFPPFTSGLVRDSDGNLYGAFALTKLPAPGGVVYKINATNQYSVLHQFRFNADGFDPQPGLVLDAAGNLYGTTTEGGPANSGVIYKIDSTGAETVLYQFPGGTKGSYPYGGVIADAAGNLYGTTLDAPPGPPTTAGEVYELSAGQKTVLAKAGPTPYGRVARDASGNFYWTNFRSWILDCGAVLKLDGSGNRTVLWEFGKYLPDGCRPYYGVTLDAAGNLYGTTHDGVGSGTNHVGTVYKIDASGRYSQLHVFTGGADGGSPSSGLIIDAAGNMYGATARGGTYNHGVVYKIDPSGNETTLYSFTGGADGDNPSALAFGPAGSFYGTAQYGGNLSACGFPYAPYAGCGVVFKLDAAGNQTVLYAFSGVDGALPSSLVTDGSGNLYGTADYGGTKGGGVVFELTGAVR
jgi:uncharacterized repeat protein (TIGR03803 family)